MPITPFHFGPGAAIHSFVPKQLSFLAFCGANVLIDVEPLYFMVTHQYPLHRFLHTYLGATLIVVATFAIFIVAHWFASRFQLPNPFKWRELGLRSIVLGAAAGSYSHVILDSFMHPDIRPFAPFSNDNPLLGVVSLGTLHWFCLVTGLLALCVLGIRRLFREANARQSFQATRVNDPLDDAR
jgi:membrane-bound metal-dependent hydrolase YbcI (DUF457 family)